MYNYRSPRPLTDNREDFPEISTKHNRSFHKQKVWSTHCIVHIVVQQKKYAAVFPPKTINWNTRKFNEKPIKIKNVTPLCSKNKISTKVPDEPMDIIRIPLHFSQQKLSLYYENEYQNSYQNKANKECAEVSQYKSKVQRHLITWKLWILQSPKLLRRLFPTAMHVKQKIG
jgi:hypothetical protein